MGNCLFGGFGQGGDDGGVIKVLTSDGGIMEFNPPITAGFITYEFPGYGIFRSHDLFWKPLCEYDELVAGESYYLLPLKDDVDGNNSHQQCHIRSNSTPAATYNVGTAAPYRMSLDSQCKSQSQSQGMGKMLKKRSHTEAFPNSKGYWKVKLVITPQQLLDILSQEVRTKELIESVRIVAKCGISSATPDIISHHWTLSTTTSNASFRKDALVVDI
ncbi:hypothetical protein L6164_017955 [Bauhinia variegata]|uniref:Uncharacterized protein n=1 Tax=Bauhinia variegata TaxID=167791 RepID=A0ACB9NAR4_BAUVA|nr:hypothetical protein L6164_017955 [Bauhinia variegata]